MSDLTDLPLVVYMLEQRMCEKIAYELWKKKSRHRLVKKVKETGILIDKLKREKSKTLRTPENIAAPSTSIHRRSQ